VNVDEQTRRHLQEMYLKEQAKIHESVAHLLSESDEIIGTGNGRVENYPGRRRPIHPHEDFMGYLIATTSSLIYIDTFGEIVISFQDVKKLKSEPFPLPATRGLFVELDERFVYFSGQESFVVALVKSFKQGMWHAERSKNPKSKSFLARIFRKQS